MQTKKFDINLNAYVEIQAYSHIGVDAINFTFP
jgi:hypothetical protein